MNFSLLTKLSAFALLATTSMVSAEESPKLRGPALVTDAKAKSTTVKKTAVNVPHGSQKKKDVEVPNFFPKDMTADQIAKFKTTAAQKRQQQRDARRDIENPNRSQEEENRERARKTDQSRSRGNDEVDPYYDNGKSGRNGNRNNNNRNNGDDDNNQDDDGNKDNFGRNREAKRIANCENNASGCHYSGPNQRCYDDCVSNGNRANAKCSNTCKYVDTGCYEGCRNGGDGIASCLGDCEENGEGNAGRAADRIDCARDCLGDQNSNKYKKCYQRKCVD